MFRTKWKNISRQENTTWSLQIKPQQCHHDDAKLRQDKWDQTPARGCKVGQPRCSHEPEKKKHYEVLKKLSQNMAPNIRKFWKKEAELKPQPGVAELLLFWDVKIKLHREFAGTADVCKCLGQSADGNLEQMSSYSEKRSENSCANDRSPASKTNSM